jgi:hypothetical protein
VFERIKRILTKEMMDAAWNDINKAFTYVGQYKKDEEQFNFYDGNIGDLNLKDYDFDVYIRIFPKTKNIK